MPAKPTIIAQITDLHIKAPGELAYGKVDTAKAFERCVAALNAFEPRPDLVVISGDLVDTPTQDEYAHLKRLLAPLEIPFIGVPGNHDSRAMMRAAFPERAYAQPSGALDQVRTVGPLEVIALDSHVTGKPHGVLEPATLQWLDATLASSTRPALVFLHHPPFRTGIEHMDVQDLFNADELAAIVRNHPRVQIVAAGHVHRATLTRFAGVAATICPAPNHAVDLDLGALRAPSFRVEPPAFHLHVWFPGGDNDGHLVTHHVPIGDFDGPHPFFGADGKLL
jgi:Icc protein